MRLKVRLTIQKEVQKGAILQQSFTVEFFVRNQQCVECQGEFRQGSWKSLVQVRQRVSHKRTFLYLEQLILKHGGKRHYQTRIDNMLCLTIFSKKSNTIPNPADIFYCNNAVYLAHRGCLSIETFQDGMDFYFPDKGKASRFISFLESEVPTRVSKEDEIDLNN